MEELEQLLQPYLEEQQVQYEENEVYARASDYAEIREQCELDDKLMIFTSFFGRGMICNPFALFQYCMAQDRFCDYRFVWVLDNIQNHCVELDAYKDDERVIFVEFHSNGYFKYLSSAKYIINNVNEQRYFVKKEGQIVINTWHGIPLKYLGYDIPNGAFESPNSYRNFLFADYIISPNAYMTDIYSNAYKLHDLYDGKIIEAGYPRCDTLINIDREAFIKKAEAYGIKIASGKKVILYAPTWRGEKYATPDISMTEYNAFMEQIKSVINPEEYQVLFKPHQVVYKTLQEQGLADDTMVPAAIDANELLGVTDILISDYSSIFFDFLATGRPILFYVSDLEEYRTTRGLYFSVDELPGPVSDDGKTVADWLKKLTCGEVKYSELFDYEKYKKAASRFVPNEDGHVCERIINAIFDHDASCVKQFRTEKPRLLVHVDNLRDEEITPACFKLLNSMDYDKYDVTFNAIVPKDREAILLSINKNVRVLCNIGRVYGTVRDTARRKYCSDNGITSSDGNDIFPSHIYETEFKRRFGASRYDCIINFSGTDSFWMNVFATQKNARQLLWFHDDLKIKIENMDASNLTEEDKNLQQLVKQFHAVDRVVGCSEAAMEVVREKISTEDTYGKFTFVHTMMDTDVLLAKAKRGQVVTLDDREWYLDIYEDMPGNSEINTKLVPYPTQDTINFAAVGQLCEERNYDTLIREFARLYAENDKVRLYIIGDGPWKQKLRTLIKELRLDGIVLLTGGVKNIHAILNRCGCLVVPSFYEWTSTTLLAAGGLGLAVVMPKFDNVKDSLIDEEAHFLIKTGKNAMYGGLKEFIGTKKAEFDPTTYNLKCMDEFDKVIDEVLHL
ncbi:MAG: CDP-glycerol glycerophosphotransferase family protein [Clostridium sp.]|nr:CDP-glycerol glycerophosphotransferase family protein [Clostridium sp.]MCM1398471.1 CDP-glycerol glycerophosphotransferase family protein [Clostridium sp.]MCM1460193.1 CDP-glycerol glycerophosphotransferase family protein [Bacteroides sp.]